MKRGGVDEGQDRRYESTENYLWLYHFLLAMLTTRWV